MTTLSINVSTNFSNQDLTGVDLIDFTNGPGKTTAATFKGSQLDAALLPGLKIDGSDGTNIIVVNNAASHSILDQPFSNWGADDRVELRGTSGDETLRSMGGNDRFFGFGGSDTFVVNRDFIEISGGTGDDQIRLRDDGMSITPGGVIINGGGGFDVLNLGAGSANFIFSDILSVEEVVFSEDPGDSHIGSFAGGHFGKGAIREVVGSSADDILGLVGQTLDLSNVKISNWSSSDLIKFEGTDGSDTHNGSAFADGMRGNAGNDVLRGGRGNDDLRGFGDIDALIGQAGADLLEGGGDADTFVYERVSDSRGKRFDTIIDFNRNTDKIDLTAIDANLDTVLEDPFTLIGTNAFGGIAGELRYEVNAEGVRVLGDVNGDKAADFAIQMNGLTKVGLFDFFL